MIRERKKETKTDTVLLILVLLLAVFGLVMLFSISEYNGRVRFGDSAYYFKKQLFATALGLMTMYIVAETDYHGSLCGWHRLLICLSMGLSTAVLFVGQEINGSKRWLNFGPLSFQPSEFAKAAVILFLTWQIQGSKKTTAGFWFMCRTMLTLLPIVGLVGSNNLSTAIIILGIGVILIFISDPGYARFIGMGVTGAAVIAVFLAAESYRLERLAIWRNPEKYEKGFQTIQGLYAIGSGGLFGRGFGSSLQKLGFVPEAQNDMIFSIICEELGLTGAFFLIVIFGLLMWRLMVIALHCRESARNTFVRWHYEPYGHSGDPEYCCGDKYYSKYRNHSSLYQLWRNFSGVSSGRDGAGFERKQKMKFYHQSEIFAYNKR